MSDESNSSRESIQSETLLDIYSEKLPELEKCIRKSKMHQKYCVKMTTYFTLAVGYTGLLALTVPSTVSATAAIAVCSVLVTLLFDQILTTWGHLVGVHSVGGHQKIPLIAKYIFMVFCCIAVIGFYGYLTFKVSPDTAVIMICTAPSILVFVLSLSNMIDWICTLSDINRIYRLIAALKSPKRIDSNGQREASRKRILELSNEGINYFQHALCSLLFLSIFLTVPYVNTLRNGPMNDVADLTYYQGFSVVHLVLFFPIIMAGIKSRRTATNEKI